MLKKEMQVKIEYLELENERLKRNGNKDPQEENKELLDKIEILNLEVEDLKEYNNELLSLPDYSDLIEDIFKIMRFDTLEELVEQYQDISEISDILEQIRQLYLKESK